MAALGVVSAPLLAELAVDVLAELDDGRLRQAEPLLATVEERGTASAVVRARD
jgi:hypothetical protein